MAKAGGNPQNLTPFKKGQSGNLKGRPKVPDLSAIIMEVVGEDGIKEIIKAMAVKAKKGGEKSSDIILDRLFGKAKQSVDLTSDGEKIAQPIIQILPPSDEIKSETE
jgi:hypothetical protein